MDAPELPCDLRMIKADYRLEGPDRCFHIRVIPEKLDVQFDIRQEDGELFAAELEALAAIIRSRVIRARLVANA